MSDKEKKNGDQCPYMGTIKRQVLDFDLDKVCSISLSTLNIYSCLVCGKYYQGCGKTTYAYSHSLDEDHHLFINLTTTQIVCLPDGYEVIDASLNDIKSNLSPKYNDNDLKLIDKSNELSYSLDGKEYLPGYIGINNLKNNDYIIVVLQAFAHLKKFRNYFLKQTFNEQRSVTNNEKIVEVFLSKLSELFRKMWNKSNFKDHISPHEILQSISVSSKKKYAVTTKKTNDAISFMAWFINTVSNFLKKHTKGDVITEYFTGTMQIEVFTLVKEEAEKLKNLSRKIVKIDGLEYFYEITKTNFYYLSLDLPSTPLFKDRGEKINIPQISLYELFKKYSGEEYVDDPIKGIKRKYKLISLPKYLILIFKRFENNMFFTEKNPTIVNFQTENMLFGDSKFNLCANIIHDGKPDNGKYRIQLRDYATDDWYEIQDLNVDKILSQSVIVSESYIHFYEMKKEKNE